MPGCLSFKAIDYYDIVTDDDGTIIAKIRDILPDENVELYQLSNAQFLEKERGEDQKVKFDISFYHYQILFALGGKLGNRSYQLGKEGWFIKDPDSDKTAEVTIRNIRILQKQMPEIYNKIRDAINKKEENIKENIEDVSKN